MMRKVTSTMRKVSSTMRKVTSTMRKICSKGLFNELCQVLT
jgi:hypothetical protein